MSNAKWIKFFEACERYQEPIGGVSWKFIWAKDSFLGSIFVSTGLIDGTRFGDYGPAPYAELKEIEWIEIPEQYDDARADPKRRLPEKSNDISGIERHLNSVGNFPLVKTERGIRIVGYEW